MVIREFVTKDFRSMTSWKNVTFLFVAKKLIKELGDSFHYNTYSLEYNNKQCLTTKKKRREKITIMRREERAMERRVTMRRRVIMRRKERITERGKKDGEKKDDCECQHDEPSVIIKSNLDLEQLLRYSRMILFIILFIKF